MNDALLPPPSVPCASATEIAGGVAGATAVARGPNSEVAPDADVAVAVTASPSCTAETARSKVAAPFASVTTSNEASSRSPSPNPARSHASPANSSTV